MFCSSVILRVLSCITETFQVIRVPSSSLEGSMLASAGTQQYSDQYITNWQGWGRKRVSRDLKYCLEKCLERLSKTTHSDNRLPFRDFNPHPSKCSYKA
jgi:hypothetical protein